MKLCDDAIHCSCSDANKENYDRMYEFIHYIATDYVELSHEKVRVQRDDYIRMARDLMKRLNER